MNPAISCIEDTLRLLLEEAKEAKATAGNDASADAFDVGRSEALSADSAYAGQPTANLRNRDCN